MSNFVITLIHLLIPIVLIVAATRNLSVPDVLRQLHFERVTMWSIIVAGAITSVILFVAFGELPATSIVKLTPINSAIIVMVLFVGHSVLRFSCRYLLTEPAYLGFFRWVKLLLAAVVITLMANHLMVLWLGWVAISVCLHKLLSFYSARPMAALGAHKKFVVARISEALMLVAFGLLYDATGSFSIEVVMSQITSMQVSTGQLSTEISIAAYLIAIAALLKCAQLPFHGWLINVVEVPTPISALLHAGVVNLGGYLLLVFAPLIAAVGGAQWLLLVVAGMGLFGAALIATTRVSVKVRLAWSTSAQMSLMLVQCALGMYELALIHLLGHSLYKAHAFLFSANAVNESLAAHMSPINKPSFLQWCLSGVVITLCLTVAIFWFGMNAALSPWLLLGLACASLVLITPAQVSRVEIGRSVVVAVALLLTYCVLKVAMLWWLPDDMPAAVAAFSVQDWWIMGIALGVFMGSWLLRLTPSSPWILRIKQALFNGLHLDEWFTRTVLRLWPVTIVPSRQVPYTKAVFNTLERNK